MRYITLKNIAPGMTLARPLLDENCNILLRSGNKLSPMVYNRLEKMQKELIYSERTEFACMADPAGTFCGISSGGIYRRCSVAAEYI